jgi:hypothetical protein
MGTSTAVGRAAKKPSFAKRPVIRCQVLAASLVHDQRGFWM